MKILDLFRRKKEPKTKQDLIDEFYKNVTPMYEKMFVLNNEILIFNTIIAI